MKKLLVIGAVASAAYYLYQQHAADAGAYTDDGVAMTILFTTDQCGDACDRTRGFLQRRTEFREYDAFDNGAGSELYRDYGGSGYLPFIVMGQQRVVGHNPGNIVSALAIEFGVDSVKAAERKALAANFDGNGEPRIVMYATARCGYCRMAREYFAANGIDYVEYDIDRDRAARRNYDALLGTGTPLLYQGYTRVSGFDRRRIESDFDL